MSGQSKSPFHARTSSAPPNDLASFAEEYRKLAIDCLKVLRVEMQLETIFHMQVCEIYVTRWHVASIKIGIYKTSNVTNLLTFKQEMTNREYFDDQDAEEPDDFIISLTSQVILVLCVTIEDHATKNVIDLAC